MIKIGALVSGELGLKALHTFYENNRIELSCVFTDFKSIRIINYCAKYKIKVFKGNPRNNSAIEFLNSIEKVDILFSVNYLFIIEKELIEYPKLFSLNIHGSLLPKYRGRTPHVWAIINGETKVGVTVHKIDTGVDTGDILLQKEIELDEENTGSDVLSKYNIIYPKLINDTINVILDNKAVFIEQVKSKATYFGKRIPEDGKINWNWSKERTRNWVRAQANPYPGAFTYLNNEKIIINRVSFSEMAYSYNMVNGKVLSAIPLIVKTPNGALELKDYYFADNKKVKIDNTDTLGV